MDSQRQSAFYTRSLPIYPFDNMLHIGTHDIKGHAFLFVGKTAVGVLLCLPESTSVRKAVKSLSESCQKDNWGFFVLGAKVESEPRTFVLKEIQKRKRRSSYETYNKIYDGKL